MRFGRIFGTATLLAISLPVFAAARTHRGTPSLQLFRKRASHPQVRSAGQRSIEDSRASEIQNALAGAGYLPGQPSGHWDAATESAMQHYQADNGWQTRLMPDSRAIIKLGLGPKQSATSESLVGGTTLTAAR